MENVLEIIDVKQSFRAGFWMKRTFVLRGISLSVPRRSVFGFLGANGAGKTTLISLIVGLRAPTSGSVKVAGFEASSPEARLRVGYLPERPYFHEHLTGEGLLAYFGALAGMSSPQIQERIPIVLGEVGMSNARRLELRRYSKGMLQRIGIAQALLHNPDFLVLDEPMSGLDPLGRKEMRELIGKLAAEGRTVFFSSHVIPDVEAICDQVALIRKGRLLGCGPISRLLESEALRTEVAFNGVELERARLELPRQFVLQSIPEGARVIVESVGDVQVLLGKVLGMGGRILWVTPQRPSLESFFEKDALSQEEPA